MEKKLLILVLLTISMVSGMAQKSDIISGLVKDSRNNAIAGATILLYGETDSIHTITNDSGYFKITDLHDSVFTLKISSLGYSVWQQVLKKDKSFYEIVLVENSNLLKEIVVKGKTPPRLKGDTLEYVARDYQRNEEDVVEDLLKNIPGVEIDKDGNISFMGQAISRIRLNGQDYLASDIKSLTTLLGAKYIDKIQFIDDYGDIAAITGRKTGQASKVLNLKTQSDFPKIVNSRVAGSYDPWGKYYNLSGQQMIYRQENHLIANVNNSNWAVLPGKGNVTNGGIDFFQQVGADLTIGVSGEARKQKSNLSVISNEETVVDEGILNLLSNTDSDDKNNRYTYKTEVRYKPGTKDLYTLKVNGQYASSTSRNQINNTQTGYQYKTHHTDGLTNMQLRDYGANFVGLHGFNKKGRFLSITVDYKPGKNSTDIDDNNTIRYYFPDSTVAKDSLLHQLSQLVSNTNNIKAEIDYVEPLNESSDVEFKYGYLHTYSNSTQIIQREDHNKEIITIDSLSSDYSNAINQHQISTVFHRKYNKIDYSIGGTSSLFDLRSSILMKGWQFFPVLQVNYKRNKQSDFTLLYQSVGIFPTFQQLRPVPDLSNIQFPVYGNPDLKAGQEHTVRIDQRKVGKNSLFVKLFGTTIRNQVVTNVILVTDSFNTVKQETHFLNSNKNFSIGGELLWSREIERKKQIFSTSLKSSLSNSQIFFDNIPYSSRNINLTGSVKSEYEFKNGSITPSLSYILNRNEYSVGGGSITNMQTLKLGIYNIVRFKGDYMVETSFQDTYNFGYNKVFNNNYMFLDLTFIKRWWNGKITSAIQGQNLMNVKNTFSQQISGNSVTISQSNRIGRVIFLCLIFTFQNSR